MPDLEAAGFVLRLREPDWEEHRLVRAEAPPANLHVNNAKTWFVHDLYETILAADPDHPHEPHPRPTA